MTTRPTEFSHRFRSRGAAATPQNTIGALKVAKAEGCRAFETDLQLCEGTVVLYHGHRLEEATDGTGYLTHIRFADLRKLSAGKGCGPEWGNERVPTFEEMLAEVEPGHLYNLELKNTPFPHPGLVDAVLRVLGQGAIPAEQIVFSSFDHDLLVELAAKAPQYRRAFLANGKFHDIGVYAQSVGCKGWHPDFSNVTEAAVVAARAAGLEINAYTLNTLEVWERAVAWGLSGIVTDVPLELRAYLDGVFTAG